MTIVNGRDHARAALHRAELALASPTFAACHAGVQYYVALIAQLRDEFPDVPFTFTVCCGDDPAAAFDALGAGITHVRIACSEGLFTQLLALANAKGALVVRG